MATWPEKIYWNAFTLWQVRHEAQLPYWPLQKILALQNQRVRAIVAHAYHTVPFYREVMDQQGLRPQDLRTADDLARLPLLTSAQVARTPERFVSRLYTAGTGVQLYSSGTSGHEKNIRYDPRALFLALAQGRRQRKVLQQFVGRPFGYREAVVAVATTASLPIRQFYEAHSWTPRRLDLERALVMLTGSSYPDNIAQLNAFRPDVVSGYGSALGAIYRWAWDHQLDIVRPKVLVYGGDHISAADRHLIETTYGIPVLSTYQAVEALRIAFQCERRTGFHVSLDAVALRVVDDNGKTQSPGLPGHLVLSNLTNRATVLLNYQLGDRVTESQTSCPCGRTLPTLVRIEGRSDDHIRFFDGRRVHALVVLEPLDGITGVIQVQLVQEGLQHFVLRVVCSSDIAWESLRQRLESVLRPVIGDDSRIDIERWESIPAEKGGKVKAVVSRCGSSA
jgi:phenylacetate-CoA ligase